MHPILNKFLDVIRPGIHSADDRQPDFDALTVAIHNPEIRHLSIQCAKALVEFGNKSAAGFIRKAVSHAADAGGPPAQYLRDQLVAIQNATAAGNVQIARDAARQKSESDKILPLLCAAGHLSAVIAGERSRLLERIAGAGNEQHANMISGVHSGLTMEEMRILGKLEPSPATVAAWELRVTVIGGQIAQLAAFGADPLKSTAHLAGLPIPGFDFREVQP